MKNKKAGLLISAVMLMILCIVMANGCSVLDKIATDGILTVEEFGERES